MDPSPTAVIDPTTMKTIAWNNLSTTTANTQDQTATNTKSGMRWSCVSNILQIQTLVRGLVSVTTRDFFFVFKYENSCILTQLFIIEFVSIQHNQHICTKHENTIQIRSTLRNSCFCECSNIYLDKPYISNINIQYT